MASVTTSISVARLGKGLSARRTFAPRTARPSRSAAQFQVSAYKVTFNMPHSVTQTIDVDEETSIMDAALNAGVKLPYACRAGACGSCVGDYSIFFLRPHTVASFELRNRVFTDGCQPRVPDSTACTFHQ